MSISVYMRIPHLTSTLTLFLAGQDVTQLSTFSTDMTLATSCHGWDLAYGPVRLVFEGKQVGKVWRNGASLQIYQT
jgi:hypothetical protein